MDWGYLSNIKPVPFSLPNRIPVLIQTPFRPGFHGLWPSPQVTVAATDRKFVLILSTLSLSLRNIKYSLYSIIQILHPFF